jgi:hypothetical protein
VVAHAFATDGYVDFIGYTHRFMFNAGAR